MQWPAFCVSFCFLWGSVSPSMPLSSPVAGAEGRERTSSSNSITWYAGAAGRLMLVTFSDECTRSDASEAFSRKERESHSDTFPVSCSHSLLFRQVPGPAVTFWPSSCCSSARVTVRLRGRGAGRGGKRGTKAPTHGDAARKPAGRSPENCHGAQTERGRFLCSPPKHCVSPTQRAPTLSRRQNTLHPAGSSSLPSAPHAWGLGTQDLSRASEQCWERQTDFRLVASGSGEG